MRLEKLMLSSSISLLTTTKAISFPTSHFVKLSSSTATATSKLKMSTFSTNNIQLPNNSNDNLEEHVQYYTLFVYGTLMSNDVVHTLIDRIPEQYPAIILNDYLSSSNANSKQMYKRHPKKGFLYPGLIITTETDNDIYENDDDEANDTKEENVEIVNGILLSGITSNELYRLDYFEDVEYTKTKCHVQIIPNDKEEETEEGLQQEVAQKMYSSNNRIIETQVYLWTYPMELLDTTRTWSYELFYQNHLQKYLQTTVQPCRQQLDTIQDKK